MNQGENFCVMIAMRLLAPPFVLFNEFYKSEEFLASLLKMAQVNCFFDGEKFQKKWKWEENS